METVHFNYNAPLLISQAETNSVPLPAVVALEQGEPLVITKVSVENQPAAKGTALSSGDVPSEKKIRTPAKKKKPAKKEDKPTGES